MFEANCTASGCHGDDPARGLGLATADAVSDDTAP